MKIIMFSLFYSKLTVWLSHFLTLICADLDDDERGLWLRKTIFFKKCVSFFFVKTFLKILKQILWGNVFGTNVITFNWSCKNLFSSFRFSHKLWRALRFCIAAFFSSIIQNIFYEYEYYNIYSDIIFCSKSWLSSYINNCVCFMNRVRILIRCLKHDS